MNKDIEQTRSFLKSMSPDHELVQEAFWTGYGHGRLQEAQWITDEWKKKHNGVDEGGVCQFIAEIMYKRMVEARDSMKNESN